MHYGARNAEFHIPAKWHIGDAVFVLQRLAEQPPTIDQRNILLVTHSIGGTKRLEFFVGGGNHNGVSIF